jgi:hypothetical protein
LQKLVSNYERKNKKMIEKLNDLKIEEFREKELKKIDRNIFFRKK